MSPSAKTLLIVSSILILIGSFLPWRREGDFVSYWTNGIQIYPSVKDNGGLLLVLLSLLLIILTFRPPLSMGNISNWILVLAIIIVIDVFFHLGELLLDQRSAPGLVGSPTIQIGMVMVVVGSLLLLVSVAILYLKPQLYDWG